MMSLKFAIKVYGFSAAGVVKGSFAALAQSKIGNVAAHSTFSVLQSWGATSALLSAHFLIPAILLGGVSYAIYTNSRTDS